MNRRKIGVDMDDVLMDFNTALCDFHNSVYNTQFKRDHIKEYDLNLLWKCGREETLKRVNDFYYSFEHQNAKPIKGALSVLKGLNLGNDLIIITARPETVSAQTYKWLDQHFPHIFTKVHFTNHYHPDPTQRKTKSQICDAEGVNIIIEDSLKNALELSQNNKKVFLLDTPWNQGKISKGIERVGGWEDLKEKLI